VVGAKTEQIAAVEAYRAGDFGGGARQQSHHRECSDALAAAGFADQAERGSARELEVEAVDGMSRLLAPEHHLEGFDLEERVGRGHERPSAAMARAISSSMASRSVMPTGSRRLGSRRRKWVKRSRLTASSRSSSASGSPWSSTRRSRSGHSSSP